MKYRVTFEKNNDSPFDAHGPEDCSKFDRQIIVEASNEDEAVEKSSGIREALGGNLSVASVEFFNESEGSFMELTPKQIKSENSGVVYLDDFFTKETMLELLNSIPEEELKPTLAERARLCDSRRSKQRSLELDGDVMWD